MTSLFSRRQILRQAASVGGASWLTWAANSLARAQEKQPAAPARSLIVLWMQGGPSQLETFDPHPGAKIAGETQAISTAVDGLQLAAGYEHLAEEANSVSFVRSVVSKEGDHERATYNVKTGFRPDPTLVHPAIGAVVCHQLQDSLDIPRHVSILPRQWPARGGYLGDQFDAFKINDPQQRIPDVQERVSKPRMQQRIKNLEKLAERFNRGRRRDLGAEKNLHEHMMQAALRMMSSDQLNAFDVKQAPEELRQEYGDTPFGRGCLAAARLVEAGVRCVEVTLGNWDTHINNHESHAELTKTLDPAFAALVRDLKRRELLDNTLVFCGGEFGRTPRINPAGGRDHWPHGFTIALAGGGIQGGKVIGETAADPKLDVEKEKLVEQNVVDPRPVEDIHATILHALGVDFSQMLDTPVGRPMIISKGKVIEELLVG